MLWPNEIQEQTMAVASLASLNSAAPNSAASSLASMTGKGALGQADFMKLLMAQMRNQNPMDPQNGADFAAQLAQFSSLDGITQLNQNFASLLTLQSLSQGTNLIGKTVVYTKDAAGNTGRGTVSSVSVIGGQIQLVVGNANVGLNQIRSVEASTK
jgi:flagellar basal-body rod modification protein FlgD